MFMIIEIIEESLGWQTFIPKDTSKRILDISGHGRDNIPYWPQLFGTY
jgi:hypothetical protein